MTTSESFIKITFFLFISFNLFADTWNPLLNNAIKNNDINLAEKIIADDIFAVNGQNHFGLTPLHIAVKNNNLSFVELLLKSGADIDSEDNKGRTPLFYAIAEKNLTITKYLILNGADYEYSTRFGFQPIHQAAKSGALNILKFLINLGVNPNT